ncbi:prepilin-type N-terminal cleavage/methylation domain-containing protein, partial [bacterium]|nr:prepilin-type N-terminal cleavage/methylation domain-containing protein [bacterium]
FIIFQSIMIKQKYAFTLVELIVVITILAIL